MTKRYCTIPDILGLREWFEGKYGQCCKVHDKDYAEKNFTRAAADKRFYMCMRGHGSWFVAVLAYVMVRLIGWIHYND